jgi:HK97 family phage major capsid protein
MIPERAHGMRIIRDNVTQPGFVNFIVTRRLGGTIRNSEAIKLLKVATA